MCGSLARADYSIIRPDFVNDVFWDFISEILKDVSSGHRQIFLDIVGPLVNLHLTLVM